MLARWPLLQAHCPCPHHHLVISLALGGPRRSLFTLAASSSVLGLPGGPGAYPGGVCGSFGLGGVLMGCQRCLGPEGAEGVRVVVVAGSRRDMRWSSN